jgi:hypothetical protein
MKYFCLFLMYVFLAASAARPALMIALLFLLLFLFLLFYIFKSKSLFVPSCGIFCAFL